ncbi:speckle-type POZ protein B-like [Daphnia carinata]|uniref:speckle-type POZ protein B-like n=1 Tax=Daphnia carinata TaxID=120202 RepID=UPI00257FF03C|nr:speckle-type POZ protein B-like [Daphnia carinata]
MASAEKVRDNLFFISWCTGNSTAANGLVTVTNLPNVFTSCQLNYSLCGTQLNLELNFVLSKTIKPKKLETISILATNDGVKQKMILSGKNWKTSWTRQTQTTRCAYGCQPHSIISFDLLIDLTPNLALTVTKGAKNVLDHILNLWKTKTLSDVTFRCSGTDIKAHVMIVASCSPVLAAMFANDFKEKTEKVVEIKDITANTFSRLLRFMYVGDASLDTVAEEEICELLVAADKYRIDTLLEDSALHLSQSLKVENASRFLVLAHLHNSSVLHEKTLEFMSKNSKAVWSRKDWMEIIKNYPELCFQATQFMLGL